MKAIVGGGGKELLLLFWFTQPIERVFEYDGSYVVFFDQWFSHQHPSAPKKL